MYHLTCGISCLLRYVNLVLFTLLLVHLIVHAHVTSSQSHLCSLCPSPRWYFSPDLKLVCSVPQILFSIVFLVPFELPSPFTDLGLRPGLYWALAFCFCFCFLFLIFWLLVTTYKCKIKLTTQPTLRFAVHVKHCYCIAWICLGLLQGRRSVVKIGGPNSFFRLSFSPSPPLPFS